MAILSVILVLLGLGAFLAMSRPFKAFTIVVPIIFGGLFVLGKGNSQLAKQIFSEMLSTDVNPLKAIMTLMSAYIGIVVIGAILGIKRASAPDIKSYEADRKAFLIWLLKWGGLFAVFREVLGWTISFLFFDGDTDAGWFLTRATTPFVLVAFVVFLAIVGSIWGGASGNKDSARQSRTRRERVQ